MNSQANFRLTRPALIAGLVAATFPIVSYSAAGKVEFAIGSVNALGVDGRTRPLTKGAEINAGDTIQTTDGRLQARFTDGGYISLQPNTEFKVEEYNFNGKSDGSEKGFFNLVKGGLRAITGSIGHTNRQAYRVNTPVATIGIRGTEFIALLNSRLLVRVGDGAVFLSNPAGDIVLYKGQVGEVGGSGDKPKQSSESPSLSAAGPKGGTPTDTKDQQDQKSLFIAGDVKDEEGNPCFASSSSGGCSFITESDVSAQIMAANASGATGAWTGTTSFDAGASGTGTAQGVLAVDFSNYTVDAALLANFTSGSYSGAQVSASASGGINSLDKSNGVFGAMSGSGVDTNFSGPTVCAGSCTFTVHGGSISGANLETANMTFSLGSLNGGGSINNQAVSMSGGIVQSCTSC